MCFITCQIHLHAVPGSLFSTDIRHGPMEHVSLHPFYMYSQTMASGPLAMVYNWFTLRDHDQRKGYAERAKYI